MADERDEAGTAQGAGVPRGDSWSARLPWNEARTARRERDHARSERDAARRALKALRVERDVALTSLATAQAERDAGREELARLQSESERARAESSERLLQRTADVIEELRGVHSLAESTAGSVRALRDELMTSSPVRSDAAAGDHVLEHLRSGDEDSRYLASPFVCGAIGQWDERTLARLVRNAPVSVAPIVKDGRLALFSSGETLRWGSATSAGYCWGALAQGSVPSDWADASERWMATGAAIGQSGIAVHADALGFQDLYYRRMGDAVYFAVRIDPLVDLDDTRLHVDWGAWASMLAVTSPVGDATPFVEIRRLRAATAWVSRGGKLALESFEPSWLAVDPDPRSSAEAIVDLIESTILPGRSARITLSGGWDSRLLAILAKRRRSMVTAFTTSHDDGYELDLEFARPVAAALGMEHQEVVPDDEAWVRNYAVVRRRTEFQTVHHTWFMPLYRQLHHGRAPVLDGLAGDVLFKNLFVTQELVAERDPGRLWQGMWSSLGGASLADEDLLRPAVREALTALSQEAFKDATSTTADHPAAATLGILGTRTARAIASSPLLLLSPEATVELPFVDAHVVASALRVPLDAKVDGQFYQRMLEAADREIAALPSTNTVKPSGRRSPRRLMLPSSLNALTSHIRASEFVRDLLEPGTLDGVLDTPISNRRYRSLTWASILGHWLSQYESSLVLDKIPWVDTGRSVEHG